MCGAGAEGISTRKRYLRRRMVELNFDLIDKFVVGFWSLDCRLPRCEFNFDLIEKFRLC